LTADLFEAVPDVRPPREVMAEGAALLRGFARPFEAELLPALRAIVKQAPFRHLITPGGHRMSVAMTNCGNVGWVSDSTGYRYDAIDPESRQPWPAIGWSTATSWSGAARRGCSFTVSPRSPMVSMPRWAASAST
jgi:alkylated DNA repair protein (DNA oxidative demethylase)